MKDILLGIFFILTLLSLSPLVNADEVENVGDAFYKINTSLYEIEATRDYCNSHFSSFIQRNNEAYDEWELQYSFFLKDFDSKYLEWKKGFNEKEQIQLVALEGVHQALVRSQIAKSYEDGAKDKCYTFKPALTRPRNNLELKYQDEINLIRDLSMRNFNDTHSSTGASSQCVWVQEQATKVAEARDKGLDKRAQKKELHNFKKTDQASDKDTRKFRAMAYNDMISDIYDLPNINKQTFSIYEFSSCEREKAGLDNDKLKHVSASLLACQKSSSAENELLGACIGKALVYKK